jgi:hypothetical protein
MMSFCGETATVLQVSLLVRRELTERARDFSIILDDVSITELSFGKEYTAAVEAKQVRALFHHPTLSYPRYIHIIVS